MVWLQQLLLFLVGVILVAVVALAIAASVLTLLPVA